MKRFLIPVLAVLCLLPFISPAFALVLGMATVWICGNPYLAVTKKLTKQLLAVSIIGLGAGMDLNVIAQTGLHGLYLTAFTIFGILAAGLLIGHCLRVNKQTSILIAIGTAICGGSAIAAAAPVLNAKDQNISVALGVVFILNAFALLIFPPLGHVLGLSQEQFGLWGALAIHDTSSVVGAAAHYGAGALETGTTVKLTRALWIIPLTFMLGLYVHARPIKSDDDEEEDSGVKAAPKKPWFIFGFVIMAALVTYFPFLQSAGEVIHGLSKRVLILTLFLIGAGLTIDAIKTAGIKPLIQGSILWLLTLCGTFALIKLDLVGLP